MPTKSETDKCWFCSCRNRYENPPSGSAIPSFVCFAWIGIVGSLYGSFWFPLPHIGLFDIPVLLELYKLEGSSLYNSFIFFTPFPQPFPRLITPTQFCLLCVFAKDCLAIAVFIHNYGKQICAVAWEKKQYLFTSVFLRKHFFHWAPHGACKESKQLLNSPPTLGEGKRDCMKAWMTFKRRTLTIA